MNYGIWLKQVKIEGLFNRFNYDLDFDNGECISILIAPNGCGKTTIFNLIDFIINPTQIRYERIKFIPFNRCECYFSNGKSTSLVSKVRGIDLENKDAQYREKILKIALPFEQQRDHFGPVIDIRELSFVFSGYVKKYPAEDLLIEEKYVLEDHEVIWKSNDILGRSKYVNGSLKVSKIQEKIPKINASDYFGLNIRYIRADRLRGTDLFSSYSKNLNPQNDSLNEIYEDSKRICHSIFNRYQHLQSELLDELPRKCLTPLNSAYNYTDFENAWYKYINERTCYQEIGLLDQSALTTDIIDLKNAYNRNGAFLTLYLQEMEHVFSPLREYYPRMKLFTDIMNSLFLVTGKKVAFSEYGLDISINNNHLPLEQLSSGEKNDLIMYYNLILNYPDNGLYLIDEPEISLHIAWQETYLDNLIEICELNSLHAIVATHSPHIINDHLELYAKKGMTNGRKSNQ